jgi:hypothetical protein
MTQQEISRMIVPIDGSTSSMHVADYAIKMAEKYGSEVRSACNKYRTVPVIPWLLPAVIPDPIKKKIEEAKQEAQKWFVEIAKNEEQRNVPRQD